MQELLIASTHVRDRAERGGGEKLNSPCNRSVYVALHMERDSQYTVYLADELHSNG